MKKIVWIALIGYVAVCMVNRVSHGQQRKFPSSRPNSNQRRRAQKNPRRPDIRRSTQPTAAERTLDRFLNNWERHSSRIRSIKGNFVRRRYDAVFGEVNDQGRIIPSVAPGKLTYNAPDRGRFEVHGKDPEHWLCTGDEVYQFDREAKRVYITTIPPDLRGQAISKGPLPFIFGMRAREAKQRYKLRLLRIRSLRNQALCLEVLPRFHNDLSNFSRVLVIVDTSTYLPRAVQLEDPTSEDRNRSTRRRKPLSRFVYTFYGKNNQTTLRINSPSNPLDFIPQTLGYKVIHNDQLSENQPKAQRR